LRDLDEFRLDLDLLSAQLRSLVQRGHLPIPDYRSYAHNQATALSKKCALAPGGNGTPWLSKNSRRRLRGYQLAGHRWSLVCPARAAWRRGPTGLVPAPCSERAYPHVHGAADEARAEPDILLSLARCSARSGEESGRR